MLIHDNKGGNVVFKSKIFYLAVFSILCVALISTGGLAAYCWEHDSETACLAETGVSCSWHTDDWGGWCEEKGCWNYWTNDTCPANLTDDRHCIWQDDINSGWCEETSCWSYEGTNETACTNEALVGMKCQWEDNCHGWNENVDCWRQQDPTACNDVSGCTWGECREFGCWNYWNQTSCNQGTGTRGQNCTWNSWGDGEEDGWCEERDCWYYQGTDPDACENNTEGMSCMWIDNYYQQDSCEPVSCWLFDYTDELTCENNAYNISWTMVYGIKFMLEQNDTIYMC